MKISPPQHIASLSAYKPGKAIADVMAEHGVTNVVKLASNENPLGPSPKGIAAATAIMGTTPSRVAKDKAAAVCEYCSDKKRRTRRQGRDSKRI